MLRSVFCIACSILRLCIDALLLLSAFFLTALTLEQVLLTIHDGLQSLWRDVNACILEFLHDCSATQQYEKDDVSLSSPRRWVLNVGRAYLL